MSHHQVESNWLLQEVVAEGRQRRGNLAVALATWQRPQLRAAFSAWASFAGCRAEAQQRFAAALGRWRAAQLSDAWRRWQTVAAAKAWQRAVIQQHTLQRQYRLLGAAFSGFRAQAAMYVTLRQTILRLRQQALAAAFASWRDAAHEQRRLVAATGAALAAWRNRAAATAFWAWRDAAVWQRHARTSLLVCISRLRDRVRLCVCFCC